MNKTFISIIVNFYNEFLTLNKLFQNLTEEEMNLMELLAAGFSKNEICSVNDVDECLASIIEKVIH